MKAKIIKRVVACALAATMVMGMSLTAFATTEAASAQPAEETSTDDGTTSEPVVTTGSDSVAGIKSTVSGVNLATVVTGTAISTPSADIAAGYGLAGNEKPFVKVYNFDAKRSTAAKAVVDTVAAASGATVGPIVNFELGKMAGGKYSLLPEDGAPILLTFGVPAGFAKGATRFAVIKVTTSGVEILENLSTKANTVTFATTAGRAVYAIVKY